MNVLIPFLLTFQIPGDADFAIGTNREWVIKKWSTIGARMGLLSQTFDIVGMPVVLEGRQYGMQMEGDVINGSLQKTDTGAMTLKKLNQVGRARLNYSQQRSYDQMRIQAGPEGKSLPAVSPQQADLDFRGPELVLTVGKPDGILDFDKGGEMNSTGSVAGFIVLKPEDKEKNNPAETTPSVRSFVSKLSFEKGQFLFDPSIFTRPQSSSTDVLRKGFGEGNVNFYLDSIEKPLDIKIPQRRSTFQGRADRIELDFTVTPRVVRLIGNVIIDIETDVLKNRVPVREVTIYFEADMKLSGWNIQREKK